MATNHTKRINEAIERRELVRIRRRFEDTLIHGYVLALGPRHFIVALVSDRLWFDGFECFRIKDVRSVETDPYAAFIESALRLRGQRKPRRPRLNLESMEALLASAGALYPLVAIHREKVEPDTCRIGSIAAVDAKEVALLEIGPGADWDEVPTTYPIRAITRVSFGGGYEEALVLVGGRGPADTSTAKAGTRRPRTVRK